MANIDDKENRTIKLRKYLSAEERSDFLGEKRSFGGHEPTGEEISTYTISRSLTPGNLAATLSDYLNVGGKGYREGLEIGRLFQDEHPTIQQCFVGYLMGALMGLAEYEMKYTDGRNEVSRSMILKLKELVDNGELQASFILK